MGSVIQMTGVTSGGGEDSLAAIDVPRDGELVGVDWSAYADFDADDEYTQLQLSFGSTRSILTNDSRQVISVLDMAVGAVESSGGRPAHANKYVTLPGLLLGMGERLYVHALSAAGVVTRFHACLHFSFDEARAPARRR